ncbi:MAG TPA: TolC family protein [Candidatus Saccharimonadales bacterium]|nr:TolC family protein [Candidatus Saccharimonadales bacterium]
MNRFPRFFLCLLLFVAAFLARAQEQPEATGNILAHPLSRLQALDIASRQNSAILKGKADLQASAGIVIQLRSVAYPVLSAGGAYNAEQSTLIENFPLPPPYNVIQFPNQNWNSEIRVQQSIYAGGRITSAFRSAKLTRQQALLNYQTVLADTLLSVRIAYDDVLVALQQIAVHEASVKLLTNELTDVQRRFQAGTVPQFDVLRAKVELANESPRLIQARNSYRIGKNNLLNLLGCTLPKTIWEDVPLQLSDSLQAVPLNIELPAALRSALEKRPELAALRKAEALRREDVVNAKSGYKPNAQIFGGYQWQSPPYENNLSDDLSGWIAGAQISWNLFDSGLTRGKVIEARAHYERAKLEVDETSRQIELEVRTAYSNFIEAREVLESQKAVQEEAEESLRLAEARMTAGSSTQLDVLSSQTALTQSRTTAIQALHDYSVTRSRLQRALGEDMDIVQK